MGMIRRCFYGQMFKFFYLVSFMKWTLPKTPLRHLMLDILSFGVFIAACVFSELAVLPMWGAIIASALSALLSPKRYFGGAVLAIVALLCFSIWRSYDDPTATFIEKMTVIFRFESGSRILLCTLVYAIAQAILSALEILRGRYERHI